ncbi:glycosyltransferase [Brachybacterium sp. FME24]|uniref:glycosyltransferase n=1 Tax=Brachybacterium sp. FME24 TaxID=2742605 RepID=UPI0018683B47|nr:glycosyltransferase [Brachybacterium sp. FME24]
MNIGSRTDTIPGSGRRIVPTGARNVSVLVQAASQHLLDDPALLAIQVSRRLPFGARVRLGRLLEKARPISPAASALGSFMAGRDAAAVRTLECLNTEPRRRSSRVAGEVAILLDRLDLIPADASATTRARASWSRGDLGEAVRILDEADAGRTRYSQRLRSELQLLQPGFRLPTSSQRQLHGHGSRSADGPVRVLHLLTNSLPHTQSGYSLRSHRILTALRDQGVESVALTRTGYPVMVGVPTARDEDVVDGIRYVRTLPSRLPQTQQERLHVEVERALELVEEFRPQVIHATTNYLNALVAQAVSDATGIPWVFEVRGLMEKTWVASHASDEGREAATASEKHRLIVAKEGEQARDAGAVVTLSTTMADELVSRGVDRDMITLVPNGVDESLFEDHVSTSRAREMVGLDDDTGCGADAFLVGAVSALVDYEGFDVLLRAVAHLLQDPRTPDGLRRRLHVVLAGDGVSRPVLADLAGELGIGDRVHLPGRVRRDQARRWVEALDVVVVPRKDVAVTRSVTPQKPIEALALRRPLIVSDLPALREVIPETESDGIAQCVPAEDPRALAAAIVASSERATSTDPCEVSASSMVQRRSWPGQVGRYAVVYSRVTSGAEEGDTHGI